MGVVMLEVVEGGQMKDGWVSSELEMRPPIGFLFCQAISFLNEKTFSFIQKCML